jgi:hypothetical protein
MDVTSHAAQDLGGGKIDQPVSAFQRFFGCGERLACPFSFNS